MNSPELNPTKDGPIQAPSKASLVLQIKPTWSVNIVTTLAEFSDLSDRLMQEVAISFDTETADWTDRSKEYLCTLQFGIPTDKSVFIVDLIAVTNRQRGKEALALAPFTKVFGDQGPIKVIHWAKFEEFQLLRSGTKLDNVVDTKLLAKKVLNEGPYGLAKLVERQLGIRIDKTRQTGDHSARPMSIEELDYDALDAEITWKLFEEGLLPIARVMGIDPLKLDWRNQRFHEHEA